MMKILIILCCCYTLFACNERRRNNFTPVSFTETNDTFFVGDIEKMNGGPLYKLPGGFTVDTLDWAVIEPKIPGTIIIPRLIEKTDAEREKMLRKKMINMAGSFLKDYNDDLSGTETKTGVAGETEMSLNNIFRDKILISYCFEMSYCDAALMRPLRCYNCINFDTRLNKFIRFGDFFNIYSNADSLYFKQLILSAVATVPLTGQLELDNKLNFSMNEEYIFFYFDAYELGAPFNTMGGVKRKYLNKFIKDAYQ
ncbi:MAG: hypothetical protein JST86_08635 [Bacteroidetes bacterium]|nr:hypothetical protein [Bacteroidota bacterium]